MSTATTETTFLRADDDMTEDTLDSVRAAIFGVLVRLATDRVEAYQSDLYHDAIWLKANVSGPTLFFYGVRDTGTNIAHPEGEELVRQWNETTWRVEVTRTDHGKWEATTTQLPPLEGSHA